MAKPPLAGIAMEKQLLEKPRKVADGTLYLDTTQKEGWQIKGGGDIVTNDEYENFDLKLDWKIAPNGNSGIILCKRGYFQIQVCLAYRPRNAGAGIITVTRCKDSQTQAGDFYDLISCSKETVKPAGRMGTKLK